MPISQAVWVAAIELGAATTRRKMNARITRSSQVPSGPGLISFDCVRMFVKVALCQNREPVFGARASLPARRAQHAQILIRASRSCGQGCPRSINEFPLLTHAVYKATEMFR